MCFVKTSKITISKPKDPVIQHEANADLTKNSKNNQTQGVNENFKSTPYSLEDTTNTDKKTLLGE